MSDNQMVERVRVMLGRSPVDSATALNPVVQPTSAPAAPSEADPPAGILPNEALQVLTLAQRTAEDHIAAANRHAQKAREDAQARAEQIQLDARSYAEQVRAEADKVLVAARTAAELTSRDAHAQAAEIRRQAELMLADARAEVERIVAKGHVQAEELKVQAQQRYEDAVGGLSVRREALQKQIESLEVFDADYRSRLTAFLQSQLRALWADQPRVIEMTDVEQQVPGGPVDSAGR